MRLGSALVAGLLVLTGCVGPGISGPTPPGLTPAPTTPAETAGTPSPPASPSSSAPVSPPAQPAAPGMSLPKYHGRRPMPAGDSGPMLWPTSVTMTVWVDWSTEVTRYGFVDVTGKLVVPPIYEGYSSCRDKAGRVSFVIALETGRNAVVLDLTGKVVAHAPTRSATCGPAGDLVFSRWFDAELGHHKDGLMDVGTGRILLPLAPGRHIEALADGVRVNVSDLKGEYFLNPRTGKRTPHKGWVADVGTDPGATALPATGKRPPGGEEPGTIGYVGLGGNWLAKPQFVEGSPFRSGHAVVKLAEDRFTFLDGSMRRVGGEWTSIEPVDLDPVESGKVGGYLVSDATGQVLLGTDLRTIVAQGSGTIECLSEADGACAVTGADGRTSLVVLPEGTVTAMPDGFVHALSPSFLAERTPEGGNVAKSILAIGSGGVAELDGSASCNHVGTAWVACDSAGWAVLPPVVVDAKGRRTAFATIEPVLDPADSGKATYYWVVAGKYQGFIDDSGAWRYRESRYTRVEE